MPISLVAFATLEPRYRPDGSSLLNLMRNLGASFGISLIFTMLARNTQTSHADITASITPYSLPWIDPAGTAERFGEYGSGLLQMIDLEINRQALMIAYLDNFHVLSYLLLAIALAILLFKPVRIPGTTPEPLP